MSNATHLLVWTAAGGARHFREGPLPIVEAETLARLKNRGKDANVYAAMPAEKLDAWLDGPTTAAAVENWGDAEPMMTNSRGEQIPARNVLGRIKLEDQTVQMMTKAARAMQAGMVKFKFDVWDEATTYRDILHANYGVKAGGSRGGMKLHSYDGLMRIEVSSADTFTFGPELEPARELINQCITSWTEGANSNLKTLVDNAFRVGAGGKIQVARVLELRTLEINDDRWATAMVAINDALRVQGSRRYIRFYERKTIEAPWVQIALDMGSI